MNRQCCSLACAAVLALISAPVRAHDYWIERSGDSYTLYQGHVYSSHKGEERVPYDPAIVKRAACAREEGEVASLDFARAYPVRVSGRCTAVLMEVSSGYWSQTLTETLRSQRAKCAALCAAGGPRKPSSGSMHGIRVWRSRFRQASKWCRSKTPSMLKAGRQAPRPSDLARPTEERGRGRLCRRCAGCYRPRWRDQCPSPSAWGAGRIGELRRTNPRP